MGFGSQEPRKKIFYCSMHAKKDKKDFAYFKIQTKEDGKYIDLPDEFKISGYLAKISHDSYEYEGKTNHTLKMSLIDGDALFVVEANVNSSMGRNLMNSILAINNWEWITASLYMNKSGYPSLGMYNNDGQMGWKFDYKTVLAPMVYEVEDPENPTKMRKVYRKVNELLHNEWVKLEATVLKNAKENPIIAAQLAPAKAAVATATPEKATEPGQPTKQEQEQFNKDMKGAPSDGAKDDVEDDGPGSDFTPPPPDFDDLPF